MRKLWIKGAMLGIFGIGWFLRPSNFHIPVGNALFAYALTRSMEPGVWAGLRKSRTRFFRAAHDDIPCLLIVSTADCFRLWRGFQRLDFCFLRFCGPVLGIPSPRIR